jgi:hypothetical protein
MATQKLDKNRSGGLQIPGCSYMPSRRKKKGEGINERMVEQSCIGRTRCVAQVATIDDEMVASRGSKTVAVGTLMMMLRSGTKGDDGSIEGMNDWITSISQGKGKEKASRGWQRGQRRIGIMARPAPRESGRATGQ